jgi:uncharacterized coiled-coil protein SlyX
MNIHQIADKLTQQETKIAELEAKIVEQDEIIASYRKQQLDTIEYGRLMHRTMWARSPSDEFYDVDVNAMVDSLAGPRWSEDYDADFTSIRPEESDDAMSIDSNGSSSKRMQMSVELCGNN